MARSGKKFKDQTLARKQKRQRKADGLHGVAKPARPTLYKEQRPRVKPRYDRYDEEAA